METNDKREARRQKILQNAQNRLDILNGIKKSIEIESLDNNIKSTDSIQTPTTTITQTTTVLQSTPSQQQEKPAVLLNANNNNNNNNNNNTNNVSNNIVNSSSIVNRSHIHANSQTTTKDESTSTATTATTTTHSNNNNKLKPNEDKKKKKSFDICVFNGYSNTEIIIFFLVALFVNFILRSAYSFIIFQNVLVPFFTVEIAHVVSYCKYMPSPSAQFQTFTALLRLSGISHKSLKNLMTIINFLFILIDNFVLYIFSFVFISIVLSFLT